jgi:hypothetical protein
MKKIMPILTILVVGGLVLSGVGMAGVTTVTYTKTTVDNFPPDIPHMYGPVYGKVGINYEYYIITIDPDADDVYYFIDWGDNTTSRWIGPYASGSTGSASHTWTEKGTYTIRAKAQDVYGLESNWSTLQVKIPRNRAIDNPLLKFFEDHPLFCKIFLLLFKGFQI